MQTSKRRSKGVDMANYTISDSQKKIYVDAEKLTQSDMLFIQLKQNEGYSVVAKKAKKKPSKNKGTAKNPDKAYIFGKITDDKMKAEAESILKGKGDGHGFFALKKWAKEKGYI